LETTTTHAIKSGKACSDTTKADGDQAMGVGPNTGKCLFKFLLNQFRDKPIDKFRRICFFTKQTKQNNKLDKILDIAVAILVKHTVAKHSINYNRTSGYA
jgi:hypothetical protein